MTDGFIDGDEASTPVPRERRIAVALTCFNRKPKTLECLEKLRAAALDGLALQIFLVDDGSTDGTAQAVGKMFPDVQVIPGGGDLYWNGGMHLAMSHALQSDVEAVLWLNDDTMVFPDALRRLVKVWDEHRRSTGKACVVVGSTQDRHTGVHTYGGCVRVRRWQPLRFRLVRPDSRRAVPCETMNGNCVLIPAAVFRVVGNLDASYLHSMGDLDYGLRCSRSDFAILVAPGFVGQCTNDAPERAARSRPVGLRANWKDVTSFRKCPPGPWWHFCLKHGGPLGPLVWCKPYASALLRGLLSGRI